MMQHKEREKIESQLWHLSNKPFDCPNDAQKAAIDVMNTCRYHLISEQSITSKNHHAGLGRPKKGMEPLQTEYFVQAYVIENTVAIAARLDEKSCYVLGTNVDELALDPIEVINAYKQQNTSIENVGFRFLQEFFRLIPYWTRLMFDIFPIRTYRDISKKLIHQEPAMKKLIIVVLCLININSYAKEKLEPTVSGKIVSFSTVTIPERASVRVDCDFDMNKGYAEEFYAYVTPYAGNFNIMAYVSSKLPHNPTFFEEIGSKVYMSQSTWGPDSGKKSITIVGVTQANEAIIIDLSHTPSTTTVSCNY